MFRDPAVGASQVGRAGDEGAGAAEELRPEFLMMFALRPIMR